MILLALETSTEACSVALLRDGELQERFELAPRRHAELVLPWIDRLLVDAGVARAALDAIAVGRGPGAFTGVRLGIAVAQGIAFALDRPVLPISTLAALAEAAGASAGQSVLAAIDARMGEVYLGAFVIDDDGQPQALGAESLQRPEQAEVPQETRWIGTGSGFAAIDGALRTRLGTTLQRCDATALPRAAAIARLGARAFARGEAIPADRLEPAYLRDKVAQTIAERAAAAPR
jgi:tRNA threonylcarbamoyladenosine biosynthesis protein TsaB